MKQWYKSKTVWVNGITAALGMLTYIVGMDVLPAGFSGYIVGVVVPIANVILRFMTKEQVTVKKQS